MMQYIHMYDQRDYDRKNGLYSVKSAYKLLQSHSSPMPLISRVQVSSICPVCNRGTKIIMHVLVQCPFARKVWMLTALDWQISGLPILMDWFCEIFIRVSPDMSMLILMVCWAFWTNCNSIVWDHTGKSPDQVFHMAIHFLQNWYAIFFLTLSSVFAYPCRPWQRLPKGRMKVNVDASIGANMSFIGFGAVVRNVASHFIVAQT
ncbi:uncharacterized protein LOC110621620 [Manihot esculenta]|uniref:uncharacterized protein LOC110621620 n=1 Tax=Manihot esculenta TaxID=3983 RepID=UPI000B5D54B2|nr:uncharacterized protein LOC110621620 [Manihot esculenta]